MLRPELLRNKRILISPLNWGYGHFSRCIPLVQQLIDQGNIVFFAGEAELFAVLKSYCPDVEFVPHLPYPFFFRKKPNFRRDLLFRLRSLLKFMVDERLTTSRIVRNLDIDVVISDHRYGFYCNRCVSILICHQLNLPLNWWEKWMQIPHMRFLRRFDYIWVPDKPGSPLSGDLSRSHTKNDTIQYIGWLSRFQFQVSPENHTRDIQTIVLLSGPYVYHAELIRRALSIYAGQFIVVGWCIEDSLKKEFPSLKFETIASWKDLDSIILTSQTILTRPGYSTLMDANYLSAQFIFIPTPKQSEQEYLSRLWEQNGIRSNN